MGTAPRSRSPSPVGQCCKQRRKHPVASKSRCMVREWNEEDCPSGVLALSLVACFGLSSQSSLDLHLSGVNSRLGSWITTAKLRIQNKHWGCLSLHRKQWAEYVERVRHGNFSRLPSSLNLVAFASSAFFSSFSSSLTRCSLSFLPSHVLR